MSNVHPCEIVYLVAKAFHITAAQLVSANRLRPNRLIPPAARDIAIYMLLRHTSLNLSAVGRELGMSSNTMFGVVHHAKARVPIDIAEDTIYAAIVEQIEAGIDAIHESRIEQAWHNLDSGDLHGRDARLAALEQGVSA